MKMKSGRKISSSPQSPRTSIIARLCPVSWLSRFKQKGGNPETSNNSTKNKNRGKVYFPFMNSSPPAGWREARFYSMHDDEDDACWRLSFCDERFDPLWYDSDDEFQLPRRNEHWSFDDMALDKKKAKQKQHNEVCDRRSRKLRRRALRKRKAEPQQGTYNGEERTSTPVERDIFQIETKKNSEGKKSKVNRVKTGFQRESAKKTTRNQAKAYCPKSECRIKVLEDMKKARKRPKKKETVEKAVEGRTVFDSFAVVKSSFNPWQDFRDSMIEMIKEKGIRWPEELEELLAAYLTLNCDEYHDLIINVFQQVWFELKG